MTINLFSIAILITLLLNWTLESLSSYLNLKKLNQHHHNDDLKNEQKKQRTAYIQATTQLSFLSTTLSLTMLLTFWFFSGFEWLDESIRQWKINPLFTGICFIGFIVLVGQIMLLPFNFYSTFKIEAQFGFNQTTIKTFILDRIKMLALFILIVCPLLAALLFFFETFGEHAWLYAWIFVTIFSLLMQYLAPTYLMPLFNQYQILEEGNLRHKIMHFAKKEDFTVSDIYIMDGSKRSSKANAFFTGFGKHRRIALFDTLLDKLNDDEVVAVLAHEIGHYKRKHVLQSTALHILQTGFMMYLLSLCLETQGLFDAFGMTHISIYAGLVLFSLLYTPIEIFISLGGLYLSRKNEYEADAFAVTALKQTEPLIQALQKLSVDHLAHPSPHFLHVWLHASHPPLNNRISAMKKHLSMPEDI